MCRLSVSASTITTTTTTTTTTITTTTTSNLLVKLMVKNDEFVFSSFFPSFFPLISLEQVRSGQVRLGYKGQT